MLPASKPLVFLLALHARCDFASSRGLPGSGGLDTGHISHAARGHPLADAETGEGTVYVLTNPAMPDLVKIGMTTNIETRLGHLYKATGVPAPFECVLAVRVSNAAAVEKALHTAFDDKRVNPNREFFEIAPEQATAILEVIQLEDVTPETGGMEDDVVRPAPGPPFRFPDLEIPEGAELHYTGGEVTVTVAGPRTVMYEGREHRLTPLTQTLKGTEKPLTATFFWKYQGRTVRDIYTEWRRTQAE